MSYETVFDLVTKLINPRLNEIILTATGYHPTSRPVTYKVDTVTFRQSQRPIIEEIMDRISEWCEEVCRKYENTYIEDLSLADAQEIVSGYFNLFLYLGQTFRIDESEELLLKLWNLGKELEGEFGLEQVFIEKTLLKMAFRSAVQQVSSQKYPKKSSTRLIAVVSGLVGLAVGILIGLYVV